MAPTFDWVVYLSRLGMAGCGGRGGRHKAGVTRHLVAVCLVGWAAW
jgi:hypothetical protein